MVKKISKLMLLTIIVLFALAIPVSAREMTIDQIGTYLDELEKSGKPISQYFIIGQYIFTSRNPIDTKDIMLASRSIKMTDNQEYNGENKEQALGDMTIQEVKRTFDGADPIGWEISNYVGEKEINKQTKFEIFYIDYKAVPNLYTVEFKVDDTVIGTTIVEEGSTIPVEKIPEATKSGYKFKEWKDEEGNTFNIEGTAITKNRTLKADWYIEVNTDSLIKTSAQSILANDFYGVKFDEENKEIIFKVYDKDKKNSDIAGTGLLYDIVKIVDNNNVKSITVNGVTFGKTDVADGAGPESKAWQQFAVLLSKLTGKISDEDIQGDPSALQAKVQAAFKTITLGDLVNLKDEITLTITLDETKARSQNNEKEETYPVKFVYNQNATILGVDGIPVKEKDELQGSKWNYEIEETYTIEDGELGDGVYNVTGYITEQQGVTGFGKNPSKYYIVYNIKPDVENENIEIQIPNGKGGYNTFNKNAMTDGVLTVIFELKESENKYFDIMVDLDGRQGTEYGPTKITINYEGLELRKTSRFGVDGVDKNEAAVSKLQTAYGWKKPEKYSTSFQTVEEDHTKINVSGLIPIYKTEEFEKQDELPFGEDELTTYYLAFSIKTEKDKIDGETTVTFINKDKEDKTLQSTAFDTNNEIYILKTLNPKAEDKTFQIKVDMDGEDKTVYAPYTLTIDWSGLELQQVSEPTEAKVAKKDALQGEEGYISEQDKADFESYKFNWEENNIEITANLEAEQNYDLKGTVKEQILKENVFAESTGYFVPIKIYGPQLENEKLQNKWTVILNNEDGSTKTVEPSPTDYENGFITVLFKIYPEGKGTSEKVKQISYQIDFDGNGDVYLPTTEIIDYSTLIFESPIVKTEQELKNKLAEKNILNIVLGNNIQLTEDLVIERNITISSNNDESYTLTAKEDSDYVITVQTETSPINVKLENIKLTGANKSGILVKANASVTAEKVDLSGNPEAGVEVEAEGTFTGNSGLAYTGEKYLNPLVKAENNGTVYLNGEKATGTTVEEIIPYDGNKKPTKTEIGDTKRVKQGYDYKHYFLNSDVANRWLKITYCGDRAIAGMPILYTMYYDKETNATYLPEPAEGINCLTSWEDGMATYTVKKWFGNNKTYNAGQIEIPTTDMSYTAELIPEYKNHVITVENEGDLEKYIGDDQYSYIVVNGEIELTKPLEIKRKVAIIGSASGSDKITGTLKGEIIINAASVLLEDINIVGSTSTQNSHVITIKEGATNFKSNQVNYSVEGENFDSILYYELQNPATILYFNNFKGKVTNYIDFSQTVDGIESIEGDRNKGTSLVGNIFDDNNEAVTFVNVKNIKDNTVLEIKQTDIKVQNDNTYFVKVSAQSKENPATIHIINLWYLDKAVTKKGKVLIDNTSENDDASGITLLRPGITATRLEVCYSSQEEPDVAKQIVIEDE